MALRDWITLVPSFIALLVPFAYQITNMSKKKSEEEDNFKVIQKIILDFFEYNNIIDYKETALSYSIFDRNTDSFNNWLKNEQLKTNQSDIYQICNYARKILFLIEDRTTDQGFEKSTFPPSLLYEYYSHPDELEADMAQEEYKKIKLLLKEIKDY